MNIPENLLYSEDHEWLRVEGDEAIIGITDFAQKELGDIVYIEVETLDEALDQGEVFGTIEAVKTVSDMMMPVAGTVIEVNEGLADEPEDVNKDPYGKGWLIKIKMSDSGQLDDLLDHTAYKANIEG